MRRNLAKFTASVAKTGYGRSYFWHEYPGFGYSSIIGKSYFGPTGMLKLCEQTATYGHKLLHDIYQRNNSQETTLVFLAWQQIEVTTKFRSRLMLLQKDVENWDNMHNNFLDRKLKLFCLYDPVGTTSQSYQCVYLDPEEDTALLYHTCRRVCVDIETRRPTPQPEFIKNHFAANRDGDFIKFDRQMAEACTRKMEIPDGVRLYKSLKRCCASQVDSNNHMNQSAYATWCFDSWADAVMDNFFENINPPVWDYILRRMSFLYLRETRIGDELTIAVWQDRANHLVFCFHILKGNDLVCQAEFEFFAPEKILPSKL